MITGTGLLYDFLKIGTLFWKNEKQVRFSGKMKNKYDFLEKGTIFWKVRFSGRTKYDFLEKVHFSGTPQKEGAQVRIYVCAPFGND